MLKACSVYEIRNCVSIFTSSVYCLTCLMPYVCVPMSCVCVVYLLFWVIFVGFFFLPHFFPFSRRLSRASCYFYGKDATKGKWTATARSSPTATTTTTTSNSSAAAAYFPSLGVIFSYYFCFVFSFFFVFLLFFPTCCSYAAATSLSTI